MERNTILELLSRASNLPVESITEGLEEEELVKLETFVSLVQQAPAAAPKGEPLTDSYVQVVPDKCDRIVWRNRYYSLHVFARQNAALSAQAAPPQAEPSKDSAREFFERHGGKFIVRDKVAVQENGPWRVMLSGNDVFAASEDFTHDVCLEISGDFEDHFQRRKYAEEICRRLNATLPQSQPTNTEAQAVPVATVVDVDLHHGRATIECVLSMGHQWPAGVSIGASLYAAAPTGGAEKDAERYQMLLRKLPSYRVQEIIALPRRQWDEVIDTEIEIAAIAASKSKEQAKGEGS